MIRDYEEENNIKKKEGAFDIWVCVDCKIKFEKNCYLKSNPKCPICKTKKLSYRGQVAR